MSQDRLRVRLSKPGGGRFLTKGATLAQLLPILEQVFGTNITRVANITQDLPLLFQNIGAADTYLASLTQDIPILQQILQGQDGSKYATILQDLPLLLQSLTDSGPWVRLGGVSSYLMDLATGSLVADTSYPLDGSISNLTSISKHKEGWLTSKSDSGIITYADRDGTLINNINVGASINTWVYVKSLDRWLSGGIGAVGIRSGSNRVVRVSDDGTGLIHIAPSLHEGTGAIGATSTHLYVPNRQSNTIFRVLYDLTGLEVINSDFLGTGGGLDTDEENGYVFYNDNSEGLYRMELDGSNDTLIVESSHIVGGSNMWGIFVDIKRSQIIFAGRPSAGGGTTRGFWRVDYDGSNLELIVEDSNAFWVFEDFDPAL